MKQEVESVCVTSIASPPVKIAQATLSGELLLVNGVGAFGDEHAQVQPLTQSHRFVEVSTALGRIDALLDESSKETPYRLLATEQHFTSARTVPLLHRQRQALWPVVAPSTSVLHARLMTDQQVLQIDAVAARASETEYLSVGGVDIPATSGFVPVSRAGDLYCVAGFMAAHGAGDLGGIAPEVLIPEGHQWKGDRVRREVHYIWQEKLLPLMQDRALEPHHISKASIYYTEADNLPEVVQAWNELFDGVPPLTNYTSVRPSGLAITDAQIEINLYLDASRELQDSKITILPDGYSACTRFGDHLVLLIYPDALPAANERKPYFDASEHQADTIARKLRAVLKEQRRDFASVARLAWFQEDTVDFLRACRIWQQYFDDRPIPVSPYIAERLPLNHIHCYVEAWVYDPKKD